MPSYSVSQTKWRITTEAENSARGSAFVFAMEIVTGGIVGKFAQLDEFCTNRLASFLPNICVIILTIFLIFLSLLGGIMTHDARKDWRDLCRETVAESDPAKLIAIVNELNRELDEEKKKKAAVFLQKIDKKRA